MERHEKAALATLRMGLGLFLLLWGVDKIVAPETTVAVFDHFYGLSIPPAAAPVLGVAEGLLAVAILLGLWKTATYGLGFLVHGVSTVSTVPQLLDPFGENHLFIAAIPVLAAFATLFVLRRGDTLWSLG